MRFFANFLKPVELSGSISNFYIAINSKYIPNKLCLIFRRYNYTIVFVAGNFKPVSRSSRGAKYCIGFGNASDSGYVN
jgi:hypothetical protein